MTHVLFLKRQWWLFATAFITALTVALLTSVYAQGETDQAQTEQADDPTVLQLGEMVITQSEFDERFNRIVRTLADQQNIPLNEETRALFEELRPRYLEQLATELVLLDEAERRGIIIADADVDAQLEQVRLTFASETEYLEFLSEAGYGDEAAFRQFIKDNLAVQAVAEVLGDEFPAAEVDLRAYYDANQAQFQRDEQVCARHILVETQETANELLSQLESGADFSELATAQSTDSASAAQGGDLGCFPRGVMVDAFEEAAFGAEVNSVVGPVQSDFGYHLIQVYDRQEAGVAPFEEVQETIRQQLGQQNLSEQISALSESANVQTFPENLSVGDTAQTGDTTQSDTSQDAGTSPDAATTQEGDSTQEPTTAQEPTVQESDVTADPFVVPDAPATLTTAFYNIYPTENSNIEGAVQVTENLDGGARVAVTLLNTETGQLYPAHFHDGDCGSGGEIVYPLESIPGGPDSVVSVVDASVSEIAESDLYINIHQPDDLSTILACGEVGLEANVSTQ